VRCDRKKITLRCERKKITVRCNKKRITVRCDRKRISVRELMRDSVEVSRNASKCRDCREVAALFDLIRLSDLLSKKGT
jgi:hypothetical protein